MNDGIKQHIRPSEQPIVKRFEEFSSRVQRSGIPVLTDFLSPREAWIAKVIANKYHINRILDGGYVDAERMRTIFHDRGNSDSTLDFQLRVLRVDFTNDGSELRHSDFLGALLGLGIRRSALGDIVFTETGSAYVFCVNQIVEVLLRDFVKVGRVSIRVQSEEVAPVAQFRKVALSEHQVTLQSFRLDSFVAHAFGFSRTKAIEPIRSGKVQLNYAVCVEPAQEIQENDLVSLRGYGRAKVLRIEGNSRSGRTFVRIGRYV